MKSALIKILIATIVLVVIIIAAILFWPAKTNRAYLKEAMSHGMIQKTAANIAAQVQNTDALVKVTPEDRKNIEKRLASCMQAKANEYVDSNDAYLNQKVDDNTAQTLARRLLAECGALD